MSGGSIKNESNVNIPRIKDNNSSRTFGARKNINRAQCQAAIWFGSYFFFLIENNEFDVVVFGLKTVRFTYVGCAVVALVHGV